MFVEARGPHVERGSLVARWSVGHEPVLVEHRDRRLSRHRPVLEVARVVMRAHDVMVLDTQREEQRAASPDERVVRTLVTAPRVVVPPDEPTLGHEPLDECPEGGAAIGGVHGEKCRT